MTVARRITAATLALALALIPIALGRCYTACERARPAPHVSTVGHGCHDVAPDESMTRLDALARPCGHSDEARTYESVSLAIGKGRSVVPVEAIQPLPGHVQVPRAGRADWVPLRSLLPRVVLSLDLPLRL